MTRPTPETFGLTDSTVETIRSQHYNREHWRDRATYIGTGVIFLCLALWILLPLEAEGFLQRLSLVAIASFFGWAFVMALFFGVSRLFLRKSEQYKRVESFDSAVRQFEKDWRQHYWKAYWDSLAGHEYHVESGNEYPKARLGFLDHWRICDATCFLVLARKRFALYIAPEGSAQFEMEAARQAVNSKTFYSTDLMCLISPKGFSKEAIQYLAKDHPKDFLCQEGNAASEIVNWFKTSNHKAPQIPLAVLEAINNPSNYLSQPLREGPPHG